MAILAHINKKLFGKEDVAIANYLDPNLVLFLSNENRDDALHALTDLINQAGKLKDRDAFFTGVCDREKIVSTGIGLGVAIPHAKLFGYTEFFIAIGIQNNHGIEWNSLDKLPVNLIFMIGGPDDRQTEYLKILSRLTCAIKDEERRRKLVLAKDGTQVIDLFEGC